MVDDSVERRVRDLHALVGVDHAASLVLVRATDPGAEERENVLLHHACITAVGKLHGAKERSRERIRCVEVVNRADHRLDDGLAAHAEPQGAIVRLGGDSGSRSRGENGARH